MSPNILVQSEQSNFLSQESLDADNLDLKIVRAEKQVLNRYKETRPNGRFQIEGIEGEPFDKEIQLEGYHQTENDNTDLQETDDDVLFALRDVIARIVDYKVKKPEESQHVRRMDQGDKKVRFKEKDQDLPSSVYEPLRPYSELDAWN